MRESDFISQNKEKWQEFEGFVKKKKANPSSLIRLFVQINDDLSQARTQYKNRSVRAYLNGIGTVLFQTLYSQRGKFWRRFLKYWTHDLPIIMYKARRDLLWSFIIFAGACLIGALSTHYDADFPRYILGDDYVNMTEDNIAKGDPMGVYKNEREDTMFLWISTNNLRVSLLTFFMGLFAGIGTIAILLQNGVMLGSFQYFFIEKDLSWVSFLTIWQHGTLEISAIIIAGAAGLTLGRGILLPGTFSRIQSFRMGAVRGVQIMCGLFPIIVLAGFLEGFVTRHTEWPDFIRLAVIIISFLFMAGYFVLLPRFRARQLGYNLPIEAPPIPYLERSIVSTSILTVQDIFGRGFLLVKRYGKRIFTVVMLGWAATAGTGIYRYLQEEGHNMREYYFFGVHRFYNYVELPEQALIHALVWAGVLWTLLWKSRRIWTIDTDGTRKNKVQVALMSLMVPLLIHGSMVAMFNFMDGGALGAIATISIIGFVLLMPYLLLITVDYCIGGSSLGQAFKAPGRLTKKSKGMLFGVFWLAVLLNFLPAYFMLIFGYENFVVGIINEFITGFVANDSQWAMPIEWTVNALFLELPFYLSFIAMAAGVVVCHHQLKELQTAATLHEKIKNMGRS